MTKWLLLVCSAAITLIAQSPLHPDLSEFRYPALAKSAGIEGRVRFLVNSDGVHLVSGHPLLVDAAKQNLEKWAILQASDTPVFVTYVFRFDLNLFTEPEFTEHEEPIGTSFERFFLRLFRRPVSRTVKVSTCGQVPDAFTITNGVEDGQPNVEIGVRTGIPCVQTSVA